MLFLILNDCALLSCDDAGPLLFSTLFIQFVNVSGQWGEASCQCCGWRQSCPKLDIHSLNNFFTFKPSNPDLLRFPASWRHTSAVILSLYFILLMLNVLKRQWWLVVTLVKIHTRPSPWNAKFLTVALPPNAWLPKLCKLLPPCQRCNFIAVYLFIPVEHLLTKNCCADDPLLFPAL